MKTLTIPMTQQTQNLLLSELEKRLEQCENDKANMPLHSRDKSKGKNEGRIIELNYAINLIKSITISRPVK